MKLVDRPKVLLIRVWLGPLPDWTDKWIEHMDRHKPYGFDYLLCNDEQEFASRLFDTLGIYVGRDVLQPGTRKVCDYDPAMGDLFRDELEGYDFWGHCNLDCVYGRMERWLTPEFLSDCDIFGNDPEAICGPFSLYRNNKDINGLYRHALKWQEVFTSPKFYGFDEGLFNECVQMARGGSRFTNHSPDCPCKLCRDVDCKQHPVLSSGWPEVRFKSAFWQSHDKQWGHHEEKVTRMHLRRLGMSPVKRALWDDVKGHEVMMFHFNRSRKWPV